MTNGLIAEWAEVRRLASIIARPATAGRAGQPETTPCGRGQTIGLAALLGLTRELAGLLLPVRPRTEFRAELHRSLITAARQQQAQRLLALPTREDAATVVAAPGRPDRMGQWLELVEGTSGRQWILGAAAVGSAVSVVGILAYVLCHRQRPVVSV
jgi:hypothetical protein